MPSSNATRHMSYSRLSIPGSGSEKRRQYGPSDSQIENLDEHRQRASRTNTLQFEHDFVRTPGTRRSSYTVAGSRMRVAGTQQAANPVHLDARRAPSGRSHAAQPQQEAAYARVDTAAGEPHQPARGTTRVASPRTATRTTRSGGRPELSTVTDFHTVVPSQHPRRVVVQQTTPPQKAVPTQRVQHAPKARPSTADRRKERPTEAPKKGRPKESVMHNIEPRKTHDPKRYVEGARLSGGDDTIVGLDISSRDRTESNAAAMNENVRRSKADRARTAWSVISTVLTILIVFACFAGLLVRSSQIAELSRANAELQRDNETISDEISKRRVEIALQEDLSNVQERAAALGMRPPAENQVQYVDLGNEILSSGDGSAAQLTAVDYAPAVQEGSYLEVFFDWLASVFGP